MWKLKNKLMPKEMDPPMAKFDDKGNLITAPNLLKNLYLEHYENRLKHRPIKDNYLDNYHKKVKLWQMRFEKLKSTRTDKWSIKDLKKKPQILEIKQDP